MSSIYKIKKTTRINDTTATSTKSNGALIVDGGIGASGSIILGGNLGITGTNNSIISLTANVSTGAYNFNLPTSVGGTSNGGDVLTSGGGGSTPMTWSTCTGTSNIVRSNGPTFGASTVTFGGPVSGITTLSTSGLLSANLGLTVTGANTSLTTLSTSGLLSANLGLTVTGANTSLTTLSTSGLLSANLGLTVSGANTSLTSLTASGLITASNGLTSTAGTTTLGASMIGAITGTTATLSTSSGTNLNIINTSTSSQIPLTVFQPNLSIGNDSRIQIGVSSTNDGEIVYKTANSISISSITTKSITGNYTLSFNGDYDLNVGTHSFIVGDNITITDGTNTSTHTITVVTVTDISFNNTTPTNNPRTVSLSSSIINTATNHNILTGNTVTISGSTTTPSSNSSYTITVLSPTSFSIPLAINSVTTPGSFTSTSLNTIQIIRNGMTTGISMDGNNNVTIGISSRGTLTLPQTTGNTLVVNSTSSSASSVTSNSISTLGGIGVTGQSYFSNTTASTSTTTGALVVAGGIGVAGNSFFGGSINLGATADTDADYFIRCAGQLSIEANNASTQNISFTNLNLSSGVSTNKAYIRIVGSSSSSSIAFGTLNNDRMSISSGGVLSISATTTSSSTTTGALIVSGGVGVAGRINAVGIKTGVIHNGITPNNTTGEGMYLTWNETNLVGESILTYTTGTGTDPSFIIRKMDVSSGTKLDIARWFNDNRMVQNGNLIVNGSLSKSSGTFDIQHPLSNNTNKRLVHSFIEGPRCDLIYRGTVILINGASSVNLDTDCVQNPESFMSAGTFVSLCANPVYYLQNHDTFDRIRGHISGNILTIMCENNNSNATIHWMVIAERIDPFIKKWERTTSEGYLITEYTTENS
jgi:hypothetical protein